MTKPKTKEPDFPPYSSWPARVDRAGRVTIPKSVREQLVGVVEGLVMWWDGRRLHLASSKEVAARAEAARKRGGKRRAPAAR